jgi:hypothetical protein
LRLLSVILIPALLVLLRPIPAFSQWTRINLSLTSKNLLNVCSTNSHTFYVTGSGGTILKTTDGGSNWNPLEGGSFHSLNAVSFAGKNTGYIVGDSALILKTTNGGVAGIDETTQASSLFSIIPNPASGKITILHEGGFNKDEITVFIYNLNGEQLFSGTFLNFPATVDIVKFPPGVYLLKITYRSGMEVKKLVIQ